MGRVGQRPRVADSRARRADGPRRGDRHRARADHPRHCDDRVHRVDGRAAHRRRPRFLRCRCGGCARRGPGTRCLGPSPRLAGTRAGAAAGAGAAQPQRQQGDIRDAGHPGRHRRHGRRADSCRTRRDAHRGRQGMAGFPDGRPAEARHRHAGTDAAPRGRRAGRPARRVGGRPWLGHQRRGALAAAARARAAGAGGTRRRCAQPPRARSRGACRHGSAQCADAGDTASRRGRTVARRRHRRRARRSPARGTRRSRTASRPTSC